MVWKSGKKVFMEKTHFMKNPVYFFLIFNISGKSRKQKLLEMFQVAVLNLFWWNLKIEGIRAFLHAFFYMHILYNIPAKNACKKALSPSFFRFNQNKKIWNSNLKLFKQLLFHTLFLGYWKLKKNIQGFSYNATFPKIPFFRIFKPCIP